MRRWSSAPSAAALIAVLACSVTPAGATGGKAAPSGSKGGAAASSSKAACLAAHEDALSLRTQKKPHAALQKLVACARVECPTVVRKECVELLSVVEKNAPTVTLEARDEAGSDETAVRVTLDGQPFADRLTGSGVDVEPGEHVFRFERADGKAIEHRVLVVEGEKNRKVAADFGTLKPPASERPPPPSREPASSVPVLAFVAGGVAIASVGSFAFFALSGKSEEKDLARSCGPSCSDDQLSGVKRDYVIADVSLVIGVVAAVTAAVLAWPAIAGAPRTGQPSNAARLAPAPWMPRVKVRVF